ncbi:D-alanyl-D-alanine carboxypeptidase family protein [Methylobacillus sp.]|mgnify:CR=1 FL=1|uniref:D-alanyl-D-alanine carboxypeptidase family protein n=1 Tax=Methylobacillus sp. TaxID=56818 RepID=UPI002FE05726
MSKPFISLFNQLAVTVAATLLGVAALNVQAADIPQPPALAVKSYQLYDFNSERVIAEQDGNSRVEPASLTKIMTAYLTFKALKNGHLTLTQTLPVSVKAWKVEGSKMFIEPNKPVTVDELLHGTIIQSGNDSSIALAEGIAGSEEGFAELMNKEAARLGMTGSHFVNSTGLPDPQHYTTAHDLALLAAALIRDFPDQYKRLYSVKEYTYNKISQPNRNRLLWLDPYVDGMKTGHTKSAGYCLVTSAQRGDTRLVSVVLGAPSDSARATESQKLLNYGFQFYESKLVYKRGAEVSSLKVWKGTDKTVTATVAKNVSITLPKGEYARVKAKIVSQQPLIAPVTAGQQIGKIEFTLDDKLIAEHTLVAAKNVEVAGIFGRMLDSIKLWFE